MSYLIKSLDRSRIVGKRQIVQLYIHTHYSQYHSLTVLKYLIKNIDRNHIIARRQIIRKTNATCTISLNNMSQDIALHTYTHTMSQCFLCFI